jgi:hypothetical protein
MPGTSELNIQALPAQTMIVASSGQMAPKTGHDHEQQALALVRQGVRLTEYQPGGPEHTWERAEEIVLASRS